MKGAGWISENSEHQRLLRDLASIITRHCKMTQTDDEAIKPYLADEAAAYISLADRWSVKRQRAWKPDEELARISRIETGLDQVADEISNLPEILRLSLHFDAERKAAPNGPLPP